MTFGSDESGIYGFLGVADWLYSVLYSFPGPWSVGPLNGKYYGTKIMDARGVPIMKVWEDGEPSERELEGFTRDEWDTYNCDTHYESELAYSLARRIVEGRNASDRDVYYGDDYGDGDAMEWMLLIMEHARWTDEVAVEIECGGPLKRRAKQECGR